MGFDADLDQLKINSAWTIGYIYFTNGRFYRIDTQTDQAPTPRQISSYRANPSNPDPYCFIREDSYYTNIVDPGPDGLCRNDDDIPLIIHNNMAENDAPYVGTLVTSYIFPNPSDNKVLVINAAGHLVLTDVNLQNETRIFDNVSSVEEIGGTLFVTALKVGNSIRIFNAKTAEISQPVATLTDNVSSNSATDLDGNLYYFATDPITGATSLRRLTLQGANAGSDTPLVNFSSGRAEFFNGGLFGSKLVYERTDGSISWYEAYDINTGTTDQITDGTRNNTLCGGYGDRLFVQQSLPGSPKEFELFQWQDGTLSPIRSGRCAGLVFADTLLSYGGFQVSRILILEETFTSPSEGYATRLATLDTQTGNIISSLDLPAGKYRSVGGWYTFNPAMVGIALTTDGTNFYMDIVTFDIDDLSTFKNITDTPNAPETLLDMVW